MARGASGEFCSKLPLPDSWVITDVFVRQPSTVTLPIVALGLRFTTNIVTDEPSFESVAVASTKGTSPPAGKRYRGSVIAYVPLSVETGKRRCPLIAEYILKT